ncbi:MAG: hypothetical protein WB816_09870 [Methylocystis sp.]
MGALVAAFSIDTARGSDDNIMFDNKHFHDFGSSVGISGTLTGDGLAYKNNTYSILCVKDRQ